MSFVRMSLALIAVLLAPVLSSAEEATFDDVERVVAIADIHGAYEAMVATLQSAQILDQDLNWNGAASHLVIVGDILDRGPRSRDAMELLMRLEGEALAAGGRVHVLIGNHEQMLLTGDLRYVSAAEYAAFADEEDAAKRQHWLELYAARKDGDAQQLQNEFDRSFPRGYFAMRRAFRADGRYGKWLLQKNVIAVINGTAFVHGGLPPVVAQVGLDGINGSLRDELRQYVETLNVLTDAEVLLPTDSHYDYAALLNAYRPNLNEDPATLQAIQDGKRLVNTLLVSVEGPLWYRNNVVCPAIVEDKRLQAALNAIGANRVVIGHTPTPKRLVTQRFDGRVIEIDTGMLNFYYKGIGSALVIAGDSVTVMNQRGESASVTETQHRDVGSRPGFLTAEQLETLLQSGNILAVAETGDTPSRTVATVSDGNFTVEAIVNKPKGRNYFPAVAAYRLDRLLALEMVPVTVMREVDGKAASLQYFPPGTIDEGQRAAANDGGSAWCAITDQWPSMYVFDILIYNEGRTQHRMLYDTQSWRLILSEQDRAFTARKGRPKHLKDAPIPISDGWRAALRALSDEKLDASLGDVLDSKRLRALKSRRDELLATD